MDWNRKPEAMLGKMAEERAIEAVLAEKRQEAMGQLTAACLTLADMLKAKGYKPEVHYAIGNDREFLRVGDGGSTFDFFYGASMFEQAVSWINELPQGYTSENCAAWFQPEAVST